ncbi:16S rRNA pseudouridine(516) synthase [Paenibacillus pectinilyticus]|uniref:Pseudouridine synthase n=1 Tax=Paenibacillus pectinilyticus TaxID=512399 RepID=A0A1C0ZV61_9BACL|nr:pseudouridine synthase [Paenibacillus pectinilyticus]OCT11993.1 16S rRNA pseudouridine(516) synthase [Paenibacillus pectinilyticus]
MKQTQRLDKILAHVGVGSRSELKRLAKEGAIYVNGVKIKDSGMQVNPDKDIIAVNGETVTYREFIYLMMNKPQGVVSATEDNRDQTVVDLLDEAYAPFEVFPVGRLDKDTEGFLLLTNDGKLAHNLLSPRKHVPKTYFAKVEWAVTEEDREAFAQGVTLDDGYETLPGILTILTSGNESEGVPSEIELTIMEGKFHQVKRMFQAVGKQVVFLKRLSMGPLALDPALALGQVRELSEEELHALRHAHEAQK